MRKVHPHARLMRQMRMVSPSLALLPALVISQRQAHLCIHPLEHPNKAIGRTGRSGVVQLHQLHQQRKQRRTLDQRAYLLVVKRAFDQISLPVAGHHTFINQGSRSSMLFMPMIKHVCPCLLCAVCGLCGEALG